MRIVLVDDHELVRMGLRMALEGVEDITVVGEAGSAEAAISLCEHQPPDVVIMDIRMGEKSGIEACQEITQAHPETRVIMLTSYGDDNLISEAIRAGAVGYVLKRGGAAEILRALAAVRQGAAALDPAVTRRVLSMMRENAAQANPFRDLTERELSVLNLLSQGKSNPEIARVLVLSDKTVRNYVSSILDKLGTANRVEAATYALQHHLQDHLDSGDQP